jgi:hypothetical protein
MPQQPHYHKANRMISDVLGADAADQTRAIQQTIEQMAQIFELLEKYQDHASDEPREPARYDNKAA